MQRMTARFEIQPLQVPSYWFPSLDSYDYVFSVARCPYVFKPILDDLEHIQRNTGSLIVPPARRGLAVVSPRARRTGRGWLIRA
jgi:hypothetical protein